METKICSQCNKPMRLRKSSYGEFWGCSGYPNCKNTEQVDEAPPSGWESATLSTMPVGSQISPFTPSNTQSSGIDHLAEIHLKIDAVVSKLDLLQKTIDTFLKDNLGAE